MTATNNTSPTRILVEVNTSSPILIKASDQPFTIRLSARVDHNSPITIDATMTLLCPQRTALESQDLTFKDTATGAYAERTQFYIQRQLPGRLAAATDSIVQLPPRDAVDAYKVDQTFSRLPAYTPDLSSERGLSDFQRELAAGVSQIRDQVNGLSPGHTYEIGLGTQMSAVRSWMEGHKVEVFLRGEIARSTFAARTLLRMELVNAATVQVVDGGHPQEGAGGE